jgi:hypothetical protein
MAPLPTSTTEGSTSRLGDMSDGMSSIDWHVLGIAFIFISLLCLVALVSFAIHHSIAVRRLRIDRAHLAKDVTQGNRHVKRLLDDNATLLQKNYTITRALVAKLEEQRSIASVASSSASSASTTPRRANGGFCDRMSINSRDINIFSSPTVRIPAALRGSPVGSLRSWTSSTPSTPVTPLEPTRRLVPARLTTPIYSNKFKRRLSKNSIEMLRIKDARETGRLGEVEANAVLTQEATKQTSAQTSECSAHRGSDEAKYCRTELPEKFYTIDLLSPSTPVVQTIRALATPKLVVAVSSPRSEQASLEADKGPSTSVSTDSYDSIRRATDEFERYWS